MPLKEILVHLDNTPACQTRVDVAVNLAQRYKSHLTGFYATSNSYYPTQRIESGLTVMEVKTLFNQKVAKANISGEWLCADGTDVVASVSDRAILQAYFADLVVVGQADPNSGERSVPSDLPERLALGAGRPVIVLPHIRIRTVGERVMMAWRGGRASSRALNDAIPFLEQAQLVNLLQVNPQDEHDQDEQKLRTYLQYHGIKVTADKLTADDVRTGDIILNRACDQGIDLIVLGVFARTRFGALGLGPVSKYLLEHMTVPILMSR